ncbi:MULTISPECIES: DUF3854 domain-containing protein [Metabacillus]|uniref:DUF3854 domain-containing protein n=1 Tax=Metabacillus TaxID=2675233 RepID=UPI0011595F46|nr:MULTISPECIES: DUF3854 domain-containing protein [Metabacillus]MCM3443609.1 DUF3854 domain-containing protein [Metabacillus halosaccharovorans]
MFTINNQTKKIQMRSTLRRTKIPGWFEFYREPCDICGHRGGCIINEEGEAIACIRSESKYPFSKNSAVPSWLHWLKGDKKRKIDVTKVAQEVGEEKKNSNILNEVYRALLDCTELNEYHYDHLTSPSRQLTDNQVFARQYRSFPEKPWEAVKEIQQLLGIEDLSGIPGFYEAKGKYGNFWSIAGTKGILLPFRNYQNEIEGFQFRIDNPPNDVEVKKQKEGLQARVIKQPNIVQVAFNGEIIMETELEFGSYKSISHEDQLLGWIKLIKGQRYYWLSSANKNKGTGSGSPAPVHVAVPSRDLLNWEVGQKRKAKTVWLSEGPLKCDIAADKIVELYDPLELEDIGTTLIALPGVGAWRLALPILKEMGVEQVNICFDADAANNIYVKKHLFECAKELKNLGYVGNLAIWKEDDGKGIDDLLINNKIPNLKRLF